MAARHVTAFAALLLQAASSMLLRGSPTPPRLQLVHITKTGGSALEAAAARRGLAWGACAYMRIAELGCPPAPEPAPDCELKASAGCPSLVKSLWHVPPQCCAADPYGESDTFAVVRNPFSRAISEFYCPWGGYDGPDCGNPEVLNWWLMKKLRNNFSGTVSFLPQHLYIFRDGLRIVDFVVAFENFSAGLDAIPGFRELGLEVSRENPAHRCPGRKLQVDDLSLETVKAIQDYARKDFELLGYSPDPRDAKLPPRERLRNTQRDGPPRAASGALSAPALATSVMRPYVPSNAGGRVGTVSVVIPTRNVERTIPKYLPMLGMLFDHGIIHEVVLVGNSASSGTVDAIVEGFRLSTLARHPDALKVVSVYDSWARHIVPLSYDDLTPGSPAGQGTAVYIGCAVATKEYVVYTDSDFPDIRPEMVTSLISPLGPQTCFTRSIHSGDHLDPSASPMSSIVSRCVVKPALMKAHLEGRVGSVQQLDGPISHGFGATRDAINSMAFPARYGMATSHMVQMDLRQQMHPCTIHQVDQGPLDQKEQNRSNKINMSAEILCGINRFLDERVPAKRQTSDAPSMDADCPQFAHDVAQVPCSSFPAEAVHPPLYNNSYAMDCNLRTVASARSRQILKLGASALQSPGAVPRTLRAPSSCESSVFAVVAVPSAVSDFQARERERAERGGVLEELGLCQIYVLGECPEGSERHECQTKVRQEAERHKDVLQVAAAEGWENLVYKSIAGLAWFSSEMGHAPFLIKRDLDVEVDFHGLVHLLRSPLPSRAHIVGRVRRDSKIWRLGEPCTGLCEPKAQVRPDVFPNQTVYPVYTSGGLYAIAGPTATQLAALLREVEPFVFEDVFTTGLLASKLGCVRYHDLGTQVYAHVG